jgi:hypothetical protein
MEIKTSLINGIFENIIIRKIFRPKKDGVSGQFGITYVRNFTITGFIQITVAIISVAVATGYGLDGRDSIPDRGKIFLFSIASRPPLRLTHSLIQWVRQAISPEVERPEHEADHSPPSSAEVKNGRPIRPLPHISSWHSA